jgi:hypothetical protein
VFRFRKWFGGSEDAKPVLYAAATSVPAGLAMGLALPFTLPRKAIRALYGARRPFRASAQGFIGGT